MARKGKHAKTTAGWEALFQPLCPYVINPGYVLLIASIFIGMSSGPTASWLANPESRDYLSSDYVNIALPFILTFVLWFWAICNKLRRRLAGRFSGPLKSDDSFYSTIGYSQLLWIVLLALAALLALVSVHLLCNTPLFLVIPTTEAILAFWLILLSSRAEESNADKTECTPTASSDRENSAYVLAIVVLIVGATFGSGIVAVTTPLDIGTLVDYLILTLVALVLHIGICILKLRHQITRMLNRHNQGIPRKQLEQVTASS